MDWSREEFGLTGAGANVLMVDGGWVRPDLDVFEDIHNGPNIRNVYNKNHWSVYEVSKFPEIKETHPNVVASVLRDFSPDVSIYSTNKYQWDDIEWAITSGKCDTIHLINASINMGFGPYDSSSLFYDRLSSAYNITFIAAVGNDKAWSCDEWPIVLRPASSYNSIAVSAYHTNGVHDAANDRMHPFRYNPTGENGYGASYKPDVVAAHWSTSQATPTVSGVVAMMIQFKPELAAKPELIKAILMASCHRKVQPSKAVPATEDVPATAAAPEEYITDGLTQRQGAGAVDAFRALSIVALGQYQAVEAPITSGTKTFSITQPAGAGEGVNVSLAWLHDVNTDVQNLNLHVFQGNSQMSESNRVNAGKQMCYFKANGGSGAYSVRVTKATAGSTPVRFAYAWSAEGTESSMPKITFHTNTSDKILTRPEVEKQLSDAIKAGVLSSNEKFHACFYDDVKGIGTQAFYANPNLRAVTLGNKIESIGLLAFSASDLWQVTIPGQIKSIGANAFGNCSNLTGASIEYGVKSLSTRMFLDCSNLSSVTIGNAVQNINEEAFYRCSKLSSITIPSSVESIGIRAFSSTSLAEVHFKRLSPPTIGTQAFYKLADGGAKGYLEPGAGIYPDPKGYQQKYGDLTICNAIAFSTKNSDKILSQKEVSEQLEGIGTGSTPFYAYFYDNVEGIGYGAFWGYSNLKTVTFGANIKSIGDLAFGFCGLTSVEIPVGVTSLGGSIFGSCSQLEFADIKAQLTSLGSGMFHGCSGLKNVTIPSSVKSIAKSAFHACSSLEQITLPKSVTSIEDYAFSYCTALTSIGLPSGLTKIGEGAFINCTALESITIPQNVTSIGAKAFENCKLLGEVFLRPLDAPTVGSSAFAGLPAGAIGYTRPGAEGHAKKYGALPVDPSGANIRTVYFINEYDWSNVYARMWKGSERSSFPMNYETTNSDGKDVYSITFNFNKYTDFCFAGEGEREWTVNIIPIGEHGTCYRPTVENYDREFEVETSEYTKEITFYPSTGSGGVLTKERAAAQMRAADIANNDKFRAYFIGGLQAVALVDDVTTIGDGAFQGRANLVGVTLGDKITSIGDSAFRFCSAIKDITLPKNLTSIGEYAFSYCGMSSITIPNKVESMGANSFWNCSSLKNVSIGSGLTGLSVGVFSFCPELTDVTIGSNVKTIGDYAFSGCGKLDKISIPGNVDSIGVGAFSNCAALASVTIPSKVTRIGDFAFSNCASLSKVVFKPITAPEIGEYAFWSLKPGGAKGYLEIGAKIQPAVGGYQSKYDDLTIDSMIGIVFSTTNTHGILSQKEVDDQLIKAGISPNNPFGFHAYFDSNVKAIGEDAFASRASLRGVTLGVPPTQLGGPVWGAGFGTTIASIGDRAFWGTGLTSLKILDSVRSIGEAAFEGCDDLYSVSMGTGLKSIGDFAFSSCPELCEVTLGISVETIGEGAFAGANLHYIVIPEKVKSIGEYAFASCRNLETVWFDPLTAPEIGAGAFSKVRSGAQGHLEPGAKVQPDKGGYKDKYDDLTIVSANEVTVYFLNNFKWKNVEAFLWNETSLSEGWDYSEKWVTPEKVGTVTVGLSKLDLYSVTFNCNKYDMVRFMSYGGSGDYYTTPIVGEYSDGCVYYLTGVEDKFEGGWQVDCYKYGATPPSSIKTVTYFGGLEIIERSELGNLTITGPEKKISASFLAIPSKLDGMTVAEIAPGAFADNDTLQRVIIPESIAVIGSGAFEDCSGLTEIGFKGAPPAVGENAFSTGNKDTVIYYDAAFAKQWAPNGETTWNDCRIVPCVWGNPTGTGKVNAADAAKILRSLVELETLSDYQDFVSDVNWDGKVSAADAARILRFLVELEKTL